jgi:uncharacterized protein (TIGR02284 family)
MDAFGLQRGQFAAELQAELRRLGDTGEKGGTVGAFVHRRWMNVRRLFTGQSEKAILAECERGERAAVEHYKEALEHEMAPEIHAIVEKQYEKVKEAHACICSLQGEAVHANE